jgi:hypothetical protein
VVPADGSAARRTSHRRRPEARRPTVPVHQAAVAAAEVMAAVAGTAA